MSEELQAEFALLIRRETSQVVATLRRLVGNLDDAEDAFAEAAIEALKRWPVKGLPTSPGAWLTTVAKRKALDMIRREQRRPNREVAANVLLQNDEPLDFHTIRDDQLRLFFTCCHPALTIDSQVRLALRLIGGLTTPEIARVFLEPEATTSKRITRAKAKISANNIAYRIPADHELPERIHAVLHVIAVIHTTGHHAPVGHTITRLELTSEATRLAHLVVQLMPDEPECVGLLALLLATDARSGTRLDAEGHFVPLATADRKGWNRDQADHARTLLERALRAGKPGPFQIQAAISCLHSLSRTFEATDWPHISDLYDVLYGLTPSIPVAVNRAIALAQHKGPDAALSLLQPLDASANRWHFYHVAVGHLHERLGDAPAALDAYRSALAVADNTIDRTHVERLITTVRGRTLAGG